MVNAEDFRKMPQGRQVVAFDFDGTITTRDSFMTWLAWRTGPAGFAAGMVRLLPEAIAYAGHRDRGRIKAAAARVFLAGESREALESSAEAFAQWAWPRLIRPDAEQVFADWKAGGAYVVIVTASPDILVAPFGRRLGAAAVLGTRLLFDGRDGALGAFAGVNCRGEEKVRRLKAFFGDNLTLAAAYGDTSGDHEMIEMAAIKGMKVFTGRPGKP